MQLNTGGVTCWLPVFYLLVRLQFGTCSAGDRSPYFESCLDDCLRLNCTEPEALLRFEQQQPVIYRLTWWRCNDECRYTCMWPTVDLFIKHGFDVPQFFGKWPFIRIFGIQEPASTLFSILNLLSFSFMLLTIRGLPVETPLRNLWLGYSLAGSFAWLWSTVFHTRDLPATEKLDYLCAFGSILFGFYASVIRIYNIQKTWLTLIVAVPFVAYFIYHVHYLVFINFDYEFNMIANVVVGIANSGHWLYWSLIEYYRRKHTYVWRCAFVILCAMSLLALEVLDFAPIFWTFDAHSLWHFGTSPLPLIWTKFILDDCQRLAIDNSLKIFRKTMTTIINSPSSYFSISNLKQLTLECPFLTPFAIGWIILSVIPVLFICGVLVSISLVAIFCCLCWIGFLILVAVPILAVVLFVTALVAAWFACVAFLLIVFIFGKNNLGNAADNGSETSKSHDE